MTSSVGIIDLDFCAVARAANVGFLEISPVLHLSDFQFTLVIAPTPSKDGYAIGFRAFSVTASIFRLCCITYSIRYVP